MWLSACFHYFANSTLRYCFKIDNPLLILGIFEGKSSNLAKKRHSLERCLFFAILHSFWGICAESTMRGMQMLSLLDYMRIVRHQKKSLLKHKA